MGDSFFNIDGIAHKAISGMTWEELFNWGFIWNMFDCSGYSPIGCGYNNDDDEILTIYYTIPEDDFGVCFGGFGKSFKVKVKYNDGIEVKCTDAIIPNYNYTIIWEESEPW